LRKAIIIGRTNVGKSMFMVNFAEYLGLKKIFLKVEYPDGKILNREMSLEIARSHLSSNSPYKTQSLQSIEVKIPVYKGRKEICIYDSSGLADGIHPDIVVREGIVQTLESLNTADIILHIIDLNSIEIDNSSSVSEIDRQIIRYGKTRTGYLFIANKIDLDKDFKGYMYLKEIFPNTYIVPISALNKEGFNEVKSFVIKSL